MADPIQSKTWVTDEVLDAPDMNTYVRDNLDFLRPVSVKASGSFSAVFASATFVTGTLDFGVTFASAPIVLMSPVTVPSNLRCVVGFDAVPTTTQVQWRVFQAQNTSISTTATVFWVAIGTLA